MSDRKAVNKYYPPEWTPAQGSINKFRNSHPLRDRARKLHLGILVIRFELPYDIWCGGCGEHVGMGVRYNAEKTKVGKYYSTIIYKFRMKCHLCDNYFEIQTDPENCDYKVICGARKKYEKWDLAENEQVVTTDRNDKKKLATDSMFKLEHGVDDKDKLKITIPRISEITEKQEVWNDDYSANKLMRQKFRGEKKSIMKSQQVDNDLLKKSSLAITLLPEHEQDRLEAAATLFKHTDNFEDEKQEKRMEIMCRPLFTSDKNNPGPSTTTTTTTTIRSTTQPGKESKLLHTLALKHKLQQQHQHGGATHSNSHPTDWAMPTTTVTTQHNTLGIVRKRNRSSSTGPSECKKQQLQQTELMTSSPVDQSQTDDIHQPDQSEVLGPVTSSSDINLSASSIASHDAIDQSCDDDKEASSLSLINASYDENSSSNSDTEDL